MTYCVAMSLDAGMIFASDSRTNAGVDQISRFSKMRTFVRDGDRVIVMLSSGNLSITQNAINILEQRARVTRRRAQPVERDVDVRRRPAARRRAARVQERATVRTWRRTTSTRTRTSSSAARSAAKCRACFDVYSEGNFIEATPETCYFQIGESKYGKPVLDRVLERGHVARRCDEVHDRLVRLDDALEHLGRACRSTSSSTRANALTHPAAAADRGDRSVLPDGSRAVGRGPAPGVRASCPNPDWT